MWDILSNLGLLKQSKVRIGRRSEQERAKAREADWSDQVGQRNSIIYKVDIPKFILFYILFIFPVQ